jgi:hypothetical protein
MKRILMLVCAWAVCGFLAHGVSANVIHSGTYSYSIAPDSLGGYYGDQGTTGPIVFSTSSVLGDGITSAPSVATWNNSRLDNSWTKNGVTITFNLEAAYSLDDVTVYCFTGDEWWRASSVDFRYSTDGISYITLGSAGSNEYGISQTFPRTYNYGGVSAQYVQVQVRNVPWYNLGISDVAITSVPEPVTLCLLSLGALGFIRRHR